MTAVPLTAAQGSTLLAAARRTLEELLGGAVATPFQEPPDPRLLEDGASFVSLHLAKALRGCVGTLTPHRSLLDDVRVNARAAAVRDERFPALGAAELPAVRLEVSVLGALVPLVVADEASLFRLLVPGRDGLLLQHDDRRATFLPQVWNGLPGPAEFLGQLKRKAGLPLDYWSSALRFWRYPVERFGE